MRAIAGIGVRWWDSLSTFFNPNPDMVTYSVATFWWLIIPYIGFGIGTILRSIFYGTSQTRYILLYRMYHQYRYDSALHRSHQDRDYRRKFHVGHDVLYDFIPS